MDRAVGVGYHNHHLPRLLHQLGFSVQQPRKPLARADAGKAWLGKHSDAIQLHRLPPYSPEFNPTEGVWKTTRKLVTHNRFFPTVQERDGALTEAFEQFRAKPDMIAGHVARYR